jgi:hypothetical protein
MKASELERRETLQSIFIGERIVRKICSRIARIKFVLERCEFAQPSRHWRIDSVLANVYAFYKPLRVGSKCSSSFVRFLIPACRS